MSGASLDWIWWVVGGLLGVTGVAMLVWALLADRARGRRRCPRCWYDLSGTDALTCSECGKTARSERRLRKTRRRWRWAGLALLLAAGGLALTATPKVRRGGWLALVPPEGLVHAWVFMPEFNVTLWNEMARRPDFYGPHWDMMIDRCITGDPRARPVTEAWKAKYGVILENIRGSQGHRRDPLLEARWLTLSPEVHFEVRSPWPQDVPVYIEPQIGVWWRHPTGCQLHVTSPHLESEPVLVFPYENLLTLPPLPEGVHELTFEVRRERIRYQDARFRVGLGYAVEDLGDETISRTIEIRGSVDDYLTGDDDPTLTDSLRRFLDPRLHWMGWPEPIDFQMAFNVTATTGPLFEGLAIGLVVEVRQHDEIVATARMAWPGGPAGDRRAYHPRNMEVHGDRARLRRADFRDGTWSFHVRGDPAMALWLDGPRRYWSGSFTVPALLVDRAKDFGPDAQPWPGPPQSLSPSVP